jgi:hypothetical protein
VFKNIFFGFTLLAIPFASLISANAPASIQWEKGLSESIAKAKETGKPVLLDIFMIG